MVQTFIMRAMLAVLLCLALQPIKAHSASQSDQLAPPVRVGVFENFPIVFKKNGEFQGIYIDLLQAVASREGWGLEFELNTWPEGIEKIQNKELDLLTSVAFSKDRSEFMDFSSEFVINNWGQVFVTESSSINSLFDLKNKKIGILSKGLTASGFRNLSTSFNIDCETVIYPGYKEIFRDIRSGVLDAGVTNSIWGGVKKREFGLKETPIVFTPFELRFSVPKGRNTSILNTLDRYLALWKATPDSPYFESMNKWFQPTTPATSYRLLLAVLAALAITSPHFFTLPS